jgi:hypothetical protein
MVQHLSRKAHIFSFVGGGWEGVSQREVPVYLYFGEYPMSSEKEMWGTQQSESLPKMKTFGPPSPPN